VEAKLGLRCSVAFLVPWQCWNVNFGYMAILCETNLTYGSTWNGL
jgi:hypothetical protein